MRTLLGAAALIVLFGATGIARDERAQTRGEPPVSVDELLAADRAFSAASAKTDLVSGLSAMFAADVIMPTPAGHFAEGKERAIEALRANPSNAGAWIEWTPIRGGISADGLQGFTFGYMTLHSTNGNVTPLKYLAYWVKGPDGWHVAAYKRALAPSAPGSTVTLPPSLPAAVVSPTTDPATIAAHRRSLEQAELSFSRAAQTTGLGAAFAKYGSADAMNLGGPKEPGFIIGAEAIGKAIGGGTEPGGSPVSWAADKVIVASSGDLGVSIGMIRRNKPPTDPKQPAATPFFTVWRRASTNAPWRYIAE